MVETIRINKFLARCNLGSRRKVEEFILQKMVEINGNIVTDLSCRVNPDSDVVKYKGKVIKPAKHDIYIMLNKPKKYLTSSKDDFGRKLVFDLLPNLDEHLFFIGRLDYMSEGLLLFTNDGDFANQIIHPRYKLPKLYKVSVKGEITKEQLDLLRYGVVINNRKTLPAKVFIQNSVNKKTVLKITIYEGRKRQIRRMIKKIGSEVLELKRLQIGDVRLGSLPVGMWRALKPNEIASLKNLAAKGNK